MKRVCLVFLIAVLLTAVGSATSNTKSLIVTMRTGQPIRKLNDQYGTKTVKKIPGTSIYLLSTNRSVDETVRKFKNDKAVASAEVNHNIRLNALADPGRTYSGLATDAAFLLDGRTKTNFYGTEVLRAYVDQPALSISGVSDARNLSTGTGTRIAYIDTGVDPDHPALKPWLAPGVDVIAGESVSELDGLSSDAAFLLDTDAAFLLDKRLFFVLNRSLISFLNGVSALPDVPPAFGHGTLVAGILHVVAPSAQIVPIKAFDIWGNTTMFHLVAAVHEATNLNIDVLNMSFSTTQDSEALRRAVARAQEDGMVVVASVGNDGRDMRYTYPANFTNVQGVAASDFEDHLAPFSNYGDSVDITAPGAFVVSTVPGGRYATAWGTSFSAPIVAGSMALVASVQTQGRSEAVQVLNAADSIDSVNPGYERQLGKGRVNAKGALQKR